MPYFGGVLELFVIMYHKIHQENLSQTFWPTFLILKKKKKKEAYEITFLSLCLCFPAHPNFWKAEDVLFI
jgi:hypothetical protein